MTKTITKKLLLFFPLCETEKPIIYHLVKDYDLMVNVYRAKVTPEEFGYLALEVTGTEKNIKAGMDFVKTFDVTINTSGKGVLRDKDKCTHCGHCITHCRVDALHIPDRATREVVYEEAKCIECLACIKVCPYDACTSAF